MTEPVNVTWSHSGLKDFENCARKYHEVKVLKRYPREETEQTLYGTQLHEQCELYIRDARPLDPNFRFMQPMLDTLVAMPGRKFPEYEMALTKDLRVCNFKDPNYWVRGIADLVIIDDDNLTARVFDYKGLPLDTPLPTPGGFVTMRDIAVGDTVYGGDGKPCVVTHKSRVHTKPCLRIMFADGASVVCDAEHKWVLVGGHVTDAAQITKGDSIYVAAPTVTPAAVLPIDPYVLGVWLADGKHTSGEITKPDAFVWEEIERRGYTLGKCGVNSRSKCRVHTVLGLAPALRALGVRGKKHIPAMYMQSSMTQRLDLLRGLMDGDGYANPKRKQAVFTTIHKAFSDQVKELAASLGYRVYQCEVQGTGFGKAVTSYPLFFNPLRHNPFLMPRKANVLQVLHEGDPVRSRGAHLRPWRRLVTAVEAVVTVPTQCIGVDSNDHTYLCTKNYLITHNSGSNKYPDASQLELMALMIFKHFPHIRRVTGGLLFVLKNTVSKTKIERDAEDATWWKYRERVARIEQAHATGVWNPKSSGLCKKYCPVLTCSFNGRN